MNRIELSICIPTYNREKYLFDTLDSILRQAVGEFPERVEIVVSDNASTDNTECMISEIRKKYANLVYYRWPENMGPDRNYLKAIELAHGRYCWFLGSDDVIREGSLRKVMDSVEGGTADIILFDRAVSDATLSSKATVNTWTRLPGDFSFDSGKEPGKFQEYLRNCNSIGGIFSFLSVIILKKSRWDSVPAKDKYVGSAYVHTHALLSMLKEGAIFKYVKDPLVLCRMGNDSFCPDPMDTGHIYRRWRLDIDGYDIISRDVFGADSREYRLIHQILKRHLNLDAMILIDAELKKTEGKQYDRRVELLLINNRFLLKYLVLRVVRLSPVSPFWKLWYMTKQLLRKNSLSGDDTT